MLIKKIKRGFTTNSSGSYEWLPTGTSSETVSSSTFKGSVFINASSTDASSSPNVSAIDKAAFSLGVITGLLALFLTAKLLWQEKRKNKLK